MNSYTPTPAPAVRVTVTLPPAEETELPAMREITREAQTPEPTAAAELPAAQAASEAEPAGGLDLMAYAPHAAIGAGILLLVLAGAALVRSRRRRDRQLEERASLEPLTLREAQDLSAARTISWINRNFRFSRVPFDLNPAYRERLEAGGRWTRISMDLRRIPSFAAVLLRQEPEPWWAWILADDEAGKYMWCSQGRRSPMPVDEILQLARRHHCTTVFSAVNLPRGPLEPSDADLKAAGELRREGLSLGLNTVSLLSAQGSFITLSYAFADGYAAPGCRVEDILAESRRSGQANRRLRLELRGLERGKIDLQ